MARSTSCAPGCLSATLLLVPEWDVYGVVKRFLRALMAMWLAVAQAETSETTLMSAAEVRALSPDEAAKATKLPAATA